MNQQYNPFGNTPTGNTPPNANGYSANPYPNGNMPPQNGAQPPYGGYTQKQNDGRPQGYPSYQGPYQGGYSYSGQMNPEFFQQQNEKMQRQQMQKKELRRFGNTVGLAVLAYFLMQVILSSVLMPLGYYDLYQENMIFQSCFNIICISLLSVAVPFGMMSLVNKSRYANPVVPTQKLPASQLSLWVGFGMLCCIVANFVVSFGLIPLFKFFGYELKSNETLKPDSVFACVIALIATAVVPAICEEFAMRCCSVQLLRKYGKGFAVLSVSIVFGLLHGNVIQFVFAFLVGLALGFVTVKTDNILPAILIHAFNNGMSVVADVFSYALSDKAGEIATSVLFVFWTIVGIIATVILLVKKQFKAPDREKTRNDTDLSFGQKMFSFFITPGMIISFIPLIILTVTTIQKV